MKTFWKILGTIVACVIILLVVLRITGLDPHERVPGLWIAGNPVTTPVSDWTFTDQYPTVKIQTQTPYLLPHSVTTNCIAYKGQLYLTSTYPPGKPKTWDMDVLRDPHIRIKIGGKVYDRTLELVTDPAEKQGEMEARKKKYPDLKTPPTNTINVFHVVG